MENTTLNNLLELKSRLEAARDRFSKRLDDIARQLNSVSETIDLIGGNASQKGASSVDLHVSPDEVREMTQLQALIHIAEKNNGRLRVAPARLLIVKAGIMKAGKNASNVLFSAIDRSERFERIKRGVYKLLPSKAAPEVEGTEPVRIRRSLMSPITRIANG